MTLRVLDLFCGAGGASWGLHQAGLKVVLGVDCWSVALETHKANLPDCEVMEADLGTLDPLTLPKVDVVWGSPPCPNFSVANKKRDPKAGMVLVNRFLEIVDTLRPRFWVMENVPPVLDYLKIQGVRSAVLNAADYGTPQIRRRAFVGRYPMPVPTHASAATGTLEGGFLPKWVTVREALSIQEAEEHRTELHLSPEQVERMKYLRGKKPKSLGKNPDGAMVFPDAVDRPARSVTGQAGNIAREGFVFDDRELRPRFETDERRTISDLDAPIGTITFGGGGPGNGEASGGARAPMIPYSWSDAMKKRHPPAQPAEPAPTVMAKWLKGGAEGLLESAPGCYRRLTVEECAILQGFPPTYIFCGSKTARYKQVGNAVCPPVACAIGKAILQEANK